ncbi:hypothetical protein SKAU_G00030330 [Synaphobranchus kaupii]|uniref:Uncharacterized protein n=1 Tax=Synaphobranchus kaupii TaxID=118154 RepID=A0A9Q1GEU8_SYNKA|nr:hypothetical protein SKAU_G00030330 [Synaphobranchus kaupii]
MGTLQSLSREAEDNDGRVWCAGAPRVPLRAGISSRARQQYAPLAAQPGIPRAGSAEKQLTNRPLSVSEVLLPLLILLQRLFILGSPTVTYRRRQSRSSPIDTSPPHKSPSSPQLTH